MHFCKQCRAKLGDYLDETLTASQREMVEAQLRECPDCARQLQEMRAIRAALQSVTPVPAPAGLRSNVRAALQTDAAARLQAHQKGDSPSVWRWPPRQFAWTGTLALTAFALYVLARPFSQSLETTAPPGDAAITEGERQPEVAPSSPQQTPRLENSKVAVKRSPTGAMPPQKQSRKREATPQTAVTDEDKLNTPDTFPRMRKAQPSSNEEAPPSPGATPSFDASGEASPISKSPSAARLAAPAAPKMTAPIIRPNLTPPQRVPPPQANKSRVVASRPMAPSPASPMLMRKAAPKRGDSGGGGLNGALSPGDRALSPPVVLVAPTEQTAPRFQMALTPVLTADALTAGSRFSALENRPGVTFRSITPGEPLADAAPPHQELAPALPSTQAAARNGNVPVVVPVPPAAGTSAFAPPIESGAPKAARALPKPIPARTLQLQVTASQDTENAQIRLLLPASLRFGAEDVANSRVVWNGSLKAGQSVPIRFSLWGTPGQEKISVVVEQKMSGEVSKTLETQMFSLPSGES